MEGYYPDKPKSASDGSHFAELCSQLLVKFLGYDYEKVKPFRDKWSQFNVGESEAGYEYKELKKADVRLHIEVEERTKIGKPWVYSGIYRQDNTKRYMCGNNIAVYVFDKPRLVEWHRNNTPREVWFGDSVGLVYQDNPNATIKSYVLNRSDAERLCVCRFVFRGGRVFFIVTQTHDPCQSCGGKGCPWCKPEKYGLPSRKENLKPKQMKWEF